MTRNAGNWRSPTHRRLGRARLSPDAVREIRTTSEGRRELALRYGVSTQTISNVRSRRTWWHV